MLSTATIYALCSEVLILLELGFHSSDSVVTNVLELLVPTLFSSNIGDEIFQRHYDLPGGQGQNLLLVQETAFRLATRARFR